MKTVHCVLNIFIFLSLFLLPTGQNSYMSYQRISSLAYGKRAKPLEFPFMVSLQKKRNGFHYCCASIVTERLVITAAHCTKGKNPRNVQVAVGSIYKNYGLTYYAVREFITHPKYVSHIYGDFDVGIVRTKEPITFTKHVQPISIYKGPEPVGSKVIAIGWGMLEGSTPDNKLMPTNLRWIDLTLMNRKKCGRWLDKKLEPYLLCTWPGKGPCPGDSGGPLIYNGKLLGIVSYGVIDKENLCIKNDPEVYVRVSAFLKWFNYVKRLS